MFKSVLRSTPRQAVLSLNRSSVAGGRQRFLSTAPPSQKSRSWKSGAARWGLAAGAVYYYNTSTVFAEEPEAAISRLDTSIHHVQESNLPTLEAIAQEKRVRQELIRRHELEKQRELDGQSGSTMVEEEGGIHGEGQSDDEEGMEGLEEEAGQQGAFNPETGEINWDCPCLGGMAHGPCGEQFREAFSCFVYSTEEPKGMECIDKFKGMQDCFREHPEMYGSELQDDEDELEEEVRGEMAARDGDPSSQDADAPSSPRKDTSGLLSSQPQQTPKKEASTNTPTTSIPETKNNGDEGGALIPKDLHDGSSSSSKDS